MLPPQDCDECGRTGVRIHRRYQGIRYCGSCYAKEFKVSRCPKCSQEARLPRNIPNAICQKCISNRPCIRCGKAGKPVGAINIYGTVCVSCAPYFKQEEPCDVCGRLSHRLTRISRFGDDLRRCEHCAVADYGTCHSCRRHRKLQELGGHLLCQLCIEGKTTLCDGCGKSIPSAKGEICEDCYWNRLFRKRALINRELLRSTYYREYFDRFSAWLCLSVGSHKASLKVSTYVLFFQEAECKWPSWPRYDELLSSLGVDFLRRYQKVITWLNVECGLEIDKEAKKVVAEEERMKRILARVPTDSLASKLIEGFWSRQKSRYSRGEISVLTVRLSLTPAVAFLKACQFGEPTTANLAKYLESAPGQRASISKFISYLNTECNLNVVLPKRGQTKSSRKNTCEKRLLNIASEGEYETHWLEWCTLALEVFHDIKVSRSSLSSESCNIHIDEGCYTLDYKEEKYFIPVPKRWESR